MKSMILKDEIFPLVDLNRSIIIENTNIITYLEIIQTLELKGIRTFIVGGAPRDWLMLEHSSDLDIVCRTSLNDLLLILLNEFPDGEVCGKISWEAGIFMWGSKDNRLDFSILHKLVKCNLKKNIYNQFYINTRNIEDDALLRDFTINTVYYSHNAKTYFDPLGVAFRDIENRYLQFACNQSIWEISPFIGMRAIKFIMKGFLPSLPIQTFLKTELPNHLVKCGRPKLLLWIDRQIVKKGLSAEEFFYVAIEYIPKHLLWLIKY